MFHQLLLGFGIRSDVAKLKGYGQNFLGPNIFVTDGVVNLAGCPEL